MFGALLGSVAAPLISGMANKGIDKAMGDDGPGGPFSLDQQWGQGHKGPEGEPGTAAPLLGQAGGDLVQGLIDKGVNTAVDQFGNAINPDKSPGERGKEQKEYADAAYPGTNPWEQLGGGGQGQGGTAGPEQAGKEARKAQDRQFQQEKEVQSAELLNREKVANIGAQAQRDVADINQTSQWGPDGKLVDSKTALNESEKMLNEAKEELAGEHTISEIKRQRWITKFERWKAQWQKEEAKRTRGERDFIDERTKHETQKSLLTMGEQRLINQKWHTEIEKTMREGNEAQIANVVSRYKEWMIWAGLGESGSKMLNNILGSMVPWKKAPMKRGWSVKTKTSTGKGQYRMNEVFGSQ